MGIRLGNVLYWAAFVFAALWLGMGIFFSSIYDGSHWASYVASIVGPSLLVWFIGQAFGYIRSGK